jgi:hypothetical protein
MLAHLRRNVIAYLALFVAMSGSAYAATVARNTVDSASIINGQVKTVDLADDAVTPAKNASIERIRLDGVVGDQVPVFSVGGESLTYSCTGSGTDYLEIMTQASTGTVNGLFVKSDNSVVHVGFGGGGVILELFQSQGASGQLIFQSGKLIETLTFHAFVGATGNHYCQFFGTLIKT